MRIARTERGYELTDLGSTNGTFLDGPRLDGPAPPHRRGHRPVRKPGRDLPPRLQRRAGRPPPGRRAPFGPLPTFSPTLALTYARCASWPAPTASSCWSAKRGSARRSPRAPSTAPPVGRGRSWPSTAPHCRRRWSRASCSDTCRAPTRPPRPARRGWSRPPRGGRCCSTRSATWPPRCRRRSSASCKTGPSPRSAPPRRAASTSGCWPPPRGLSTGPGTEAMRADLVSPPGRRPDLHPAAPPAPRGGAGPPAPLRRRGHRRRRGRGAAGALPPRLAPQRSRAGEDRRQQRWP